MKIGFTGDRCTVPPPHSRLAVYAKAIAALALAEQVAQWIPGVRNDLRDQLQRTASSVVLNLAEGSSEFSPAEKARFYRIARRSAAESLAIVDVLETVIGPPPQAMAMRAAFEEVMAMSTRLVQAAESRRK